MISTSHNLRRFSGVTICLLAAVLLFGGFGCKGSSLSKEEEKKFEPIVLKYWRVLDDQDAFDTILARYKALHPNITVQYRKFRLDEYERELLDALAEDDGPDVISLHNTWLHDWKPRLLPVPPVLNVGYQEVRGSLKKEIVPVVKQVPGMTVTRLANEFIDAVAQDVVIDTPQEDPRLPEVPRIYGLPLYVDTLVMYYNRDILNENGIAQPATYWRQFQEQVKTITRLDEVGTIIRSAAAIGTASNVQRPSDILALLMMQNGARMSDENGMAVFDQYPAQLAGRTYPPGAEALIFYTDFANPTKEVYTWNNKMPDALRAFVDGQTAYFFGYAYHLPSIRAQNPDLNFGIAAFPQIEGNPKIANANYWVETVSNKSTHPDEAWEFVQFMTTEAQAQTYLEKTNRPTALRALIDGQLDNLDLGVFASQLDSARSWYEGTDSAAVDEAFAEMIEQALADEADPTHIIELGATKVNQTIE